MNYHDIIEIETDNDVRLIGFFVEETRRNIFIATNSEDLPVITLAKGDINRVRTLSYEADV